ncbi:hypothetical protein B0G71_1428 [Paraburkholderia sp. BL27I4N3]|uniref:hypothetical protein n=1 Tax=Paraburkholderia sp. BL27I4N3 TaxID=1938805 RepID=UPI000E2883A6|nr:hypothetical protein [Paraburkholderia sp. BL27I4N3]REE18412.1 hypothetical protein B0G71_1428 [Paraburkholderia sp. BL27I4N3]
MSTDKELTSVKGVATLERPRYSPGLLLEADDLTAGIDYTRDLMRLMFRSLFGCGVVCGLGVTAKLTCHGKEVTVGVDKGLALDCMGNPIQICKAQTLVYDLGCSGKPPKAIFVVACYVERCCSPRDVACSEDDSSGQTVNTRSVDGFQIKLYDHRPECACGCETKEEKTDEKKDAPDPCACYDDHNRGVCDCGCDCNCVLLAVITEPDSNTGDNENKSDGKSSTNTEVRLVVSKEGRRQIRPVLTGFLDCLSRKSAEPKKDTGGDKAATQ